MQADPRPGPEHHLASRPTLGDLLYANPAPRVSEGEWRALVQAIASGDQRALHALYERAHRLVFTLVVRVTACRETADEVTVDVFHEIWRRAASYDPGGGSVVGWIMNQARCRAIDRLRTEHRQKRGGGTAAAIPGDPAGAEPVVAAELEDRSRVLRDALQRLTAPERQAIEAAFFGGLSYREVAERLGEPLGTIKTRIRSGLAKLREALFARGGRP